MQLKLEAFVGTPCAEYGKQALYRARRNGVFDGPLAVCLVFLAKLIIVIKEINRKVELANIVAALGRHDAVEVVEVVVSDGEGPEDVPLD